MAEPQVLGMQGVDAHGTMGDRKIVHSPVFQCYVEETVGKYCDDSLVNAMRYYDEFGEGDFQTWRTAKGR